VARLDKVTNVICHSRDSETHLLTVLKNIYITEKSLVMAWLWPTLNAWLISQQTSITNLQSVADTCVSLLGVPATIKQKRAVLTSP
jgi:hypothetical protein